MTIFQSYELSHHVSVIPITSSFCNCSRTSNSSRISMLQISIFPMRTLLRLPTLVPQALYFHQNLSGQWLCQNTVHTGTSSRRASSGKSFGIVMFSSRPVDSSGWFPFCCYFLKKKIPLTFSFWFPVIER